MPNILMTLSGKLTIVREKFWVLELQSKCYKRKLEIESEKIKSNAEMKSKDIKKFCKHKEEAEKLIKRAVEQLKLSARSYHRILKIARTIADLEGNENIQQNQIAEALQYRPKEKTY